MEFLPEDRQLFGARAGFGEALRDVARAIAPHNTAKVAGRRWKIDPTTADNVLKGVASGPTVVKAVRAEGPHAWDLWDALGELIIGESRDDHDERKLQLILEKTAHARTRLEARRARRLELEAGSGGFNQVADR